jgi:hypothetical protein
MVAARSENFILFSRPILIIRNPPHPPHAKCYMTEHMCFRIWYETRFNKNRHTLKIRNMEIVGSNPTQGMDVCTVCVYSVSVVLGVGRGLATG